MNRSALIDLLRTDPRDVGCAETWELIHVYAELVVHGGDPEVRFPGMVAHLMSCAPCDHDLHGLVDLVRESIAADDSTSRG